MDLSGNDLYLLSICIVQTILLSFLGVIVFFFRNKRRQEQFHEGVELYQFYRIPKFDDGFRENGLYRKVSTYINTLPMAEDSDFANLFTPRSADEISLKIDSNRCVQDSFLGAKLWWKNEVSEGDDNGRSLVLKILKKEKEGILRPYLQHVQAMADEITKRRKELRLYTNDNNRWRSVPFRHPANFETVAMDPETKAKLVSDLESFVKGRQFYNRLGRSWKRSYLLYGAPGTGKSMTIAAMANLLGFDIYDVDLLKIADDSDLRFLLQQTTGKSILVIEDLDEFLLRLSRREESPRRIEATGDIPTGVTYSGILNFMDGIWSCSEEERIMVFTVASKEQIDPAILRPGRIDMNIFFPNCTFPAFKTLANNYLGLKEHKLFTNVEEHFQAGASITPAEVGEIMILNRSSPNRALKTVISVLQTSNRTVKSSTVTGQGNVNSEGMPESGENARRETPTAADFRRFYSFLRSSNRKKLPKMPC